MPIGFKIKEVMSGYDSALKPFEFRVTWGMKRIKDLFKSGPMRFDLKGTVLFNGMRFPCEGYLLIDYFGTHTVTYVFDFGDDINASPDVPMGNWGLKPFLYVGQKVNIKPWNLLTSHTTCFGTIIEQPDSTLMSRTVAFFKFRTVPKFLTSFRFTWTRGRR